MIGLKEFFVMKSPLAFYCKAKHKLKITHIITVMQLKKLFLPVIMSTTTVLYVFTIMFCHGKVLAAEVNLNDQHAAD